MGPTFGQMEDISIIQGDFQCTMYIRREHSFREIMVALKRAVGLRVVDQIYLELVYFVTALVPSETACLANSPGRIRRTAVCTSLLVMVDLLL